MRNTFFLSMAAAASFFVLTSASFAAGECQKDSDCTGGDVCILAATPHVCKPPQPAGAPCKRDAVCVSKKCAIPAGKDVGICQ